MARSFGASGLFSETETTTGCQRSVGSKGRSVSKQLILLAAVNRSILRQQLALDSLKEKELSSDPNNVNINNNRRAKPKERKQAAGGGSKRRTKAKDVLGSCFLEVERCIESALVEIENSCHKFHKAMLTYVCHES